MEARLRLGEEHWRAKLTDHDVDLLRHFLQERLQLVRRCQAAGFRGSAVAREVGVA